MQPPIVTSNSLDVFEGDTDSEDEELDEKMLVNDISYINKSCYRSEGTINRQVQLLNVTEEDVTEGKVTEEEVTEEEREEEELLQAPPGLGEFIGI